MNATNKPSFAFLRVPSWIRSAIMLLPLLVALPAIANSRAANRAGVVIRYADGTVRSSCVTFDEASISGMELLQRAEPEVIAQPAPGNAAVCKIGADGCDYPAEPCFCKFGAGNSGEYWAYWQLAGATWRYGQQGAGARRVGNGDVDGWAYGSGSVESGVQPPVTTFAEVCPLASASLEPLVTSSEPPAAVPSPPAVSTAASAVPGASIEPQRAEASPAAAGAAAPGDGRSTQPAGGWGSYLIFAAMLGAVLGAIAITLRRRGTG